MTVREFIIKLLGFFERFIPAFLLEINRRKQNKIDDARYEAKKEKYYRSKAESELEYHEENENIDTVEFIDDYLTDDESDS